MGAHNVGQLAEGAGGNRVRTGKRPTVYTSARRRRFLVSQKQRRRRPGHLPRRESCSRNLPHRPAFCGLENLSAYSPWRGRLTPAMAGAQPGDLQKPRKRWERRRSCGPLPMRAPNEADSRSDLQIYVVAGVGFEPT